MKKQVKEAAVVVGVGLKSQPFQEVKESLAELEELASAAGAEVVGTLAQSVHQFHPATLLGAGKVQEIKDFVLESQATLVVIDHQLTGGQTRNLESEIGARVLDRSQLILDIFAQRAKTYEGKLQVELAQMLDQLPRMVGAWMGSLSRQGGGIGTRGPGETALEIDRRRIRDRVKQIRKKLESVRKNRSQHRALRRRQRVPSFALIGYTNSGKSTLLNKLTNSDVHTRDQVFATLDPTTRKVHLPELGDTVITDTVGFIRNLPTHLIEAFKATLEESAEADILLHVIDLSNPNMEHQIQVVEDLVEEFGWGDKPLIYVYNKVDVAPFEKQFRVQTQPRVFTSALTGDGIERLKKLMTESIKELHQEVELYFPRSLEHKIYELGRETQISKTEPGQRGTICFAHLNPSQLSRWRDFLVKESSIGTT